MVEKQEIIVQDTIRQICTLFGIDPYSSISEGTLIITCRPHKAQELIRRLTDEGIMASIVGEIMEPKKGMVYYENQHSYPLTHPKVDPFWPAFGKAASEGQLK